MNSPTNLYAHVFKYVHPQNAKMGGVPIYIHIYIYIYTYVACTISKNIKSSTPMLQVVKVLQVQMGHPPKIGDTPFESQSNPGVRTVYPNLYFNYGRTCFWLGSSLPCIYPGFDCSFGHRDSIATRTPKIAALEVGQGAMTFPI